MKDNKKFLITALSLFSCSIFLLDNYFPVFAQDPTEETIQETLRPDFDYWENAQKFYASLNTFSSAFTTVFPASKPVVDTAIAVSYFPAFLLGVFSDWLDANFPSQTVARSGIIYPMTHCYQDSDGNLALEPASVYCLVYTFPANYPFDADSPFTRVLISSYHCQVLGFTPSVQGYTYDYTLEFGSYLTNTTDPVTDLYSISSFDYLWRTSSNEGSFRTTGDSYDYNFSRFRDILRFRNFSETSSFERGQFAFYAGFPHISVSTDDIDSLDPSQIAPYIQNLFETSVPGLSDDPDWQDLMKNVPAYPVSGDYYDIKDPFLPALPNANTLPTLPDIDPSESSIIQPMLQGSKTLFGLIGSFIKDSGLLPWILIIVVCSIAWFFLRW